MRRSMSYIILFLLFLFLFSSCTQTDPVVEALREQYDALAEEQAELESLLRQVEAKYAMLLDDKAEIAANITVISQELESASEEDKAVLETNLENYQKAQEDVGALLDTYTAQKTQWLDQLEEVEQELATLVIELAEQQYEMLPANETQRYQCIPPWIFTVGIHLKIAKTSCKTCVNVV